MTDSAPTKPSSKFNKKGLPSFDDELREPETFRERLITNIWNNVSRLFGQVFGSSYMPLNDFNLVQKQKILDYLFRKNVILAIQLKQAERKKFFRQTEYQEGSSTKDKLNIEKKKLKDSDDRIESLLLIRKQIRSYFINETAYEYNRARYVSMSYGFMAGVCLVLTVMRLSTPTRKAFACITLAHIFGQFAVYKKMDFVFDQLYPVFQQDVKIALAQNKLEQFEGENMKKLIQTLKL